ncbi:MAG: aspartate/glutamate racemase family protein [Sphingomonadales bacterium]|nr:aspartate/glutamate racemase family protein [Sphingomonadales bacterium]
MAKFKHIRLLTPVYNDVSIRLQDVENLQRRDLMISQTGIPVGTPSVECEFDEALAAPYIVGRAMEAEQNNKAINENQQASDEERKQIVDALIVDCMSDPGLQAARETVSIPVFGPREVCMHIAAMLGHRFSYIGIKSRNRPRIERHAATYGLLHHIASVRAVDLSVTDVTQGGQHKLHERIVEESIAAVEQDGADIILIGCTAFFGCEKIVGKALLDKGHDIPVINPIRTTIAYVAGLLDLGLSHSRRTYPFPPIKKRVGYDIPNTYNILNE